MTLNKRRFEALRQRLYSKLICMEIKTLPDFKASTS